jgi:thioredoxin-related protein
MNKYFNLVILLLFCFTLTNAQKTDSQKEQINWISFDKAVELNKSGTAKKIFIDMYTDWCGWCKKLDATTYQDPTVIAYLNKNFYSVRMDAEMKDTIYYDGRMFVNPDPAKARNTHELAYALLGGKLSYPTLVYLDEKMNMLSQVPGFMNAENLMQVLTYFGENNQGKISWEDYQKKINTK